jgi:Class II flagellar assembly regulator
MRINRQSALSRSTSAKRSSGRAGGAAQFSIEQSGTGSASVSVQSLRPLGPVDALLSLQEVPDATLSTRRAMAHAENILDALEDVQMGLVTGILPKGQLTRLLGLIRREQSQVQDPKLAEVLKEVELRAHVELAKLGEFA